MWNRKVGSGGRWDLNAVIQNNKAFRNPSIYSKLIDHMNIDELGNYSLFSLTKQTFRCHIPLMIQKLTFSLFKVILATFRLILQLRSLCLILLTFIPPAGMPPYCVNL